MLKSLEIKNFRGISEGYIEGFDRLNVFVGKNNSGKSSILEALAILIDPYNIPHIIKRRGWFGLDSVLSIFRYRNAEEPIEIKGNGIELKIKRGIPFADNVEFLVKTKNFKEEVIVLDVEHLRLEEKKSTKTEFEVYIDSDGKHQNFVDVEGKCLESVFIDYKMIQEVGLKEAYSKVFEKGYKAHERLINVINKVYPDVIDIRLFSEKIGPEVVFENGRVPMYAMGDGFKSAYVTLSFLMNIENGYIIYEEPENYQHPSSRELIVEGICESAKINQIFISTHSIELIDEILETADVDVKFFVLELDQASGKLSYYSFDAESAKFRRRELEADLRG